MKFDWLEAEEIKLLFILFRIIKIHSIIYISYILHACNIIENVFIAYSLEGYISLNVIYLYNNSIEIFTKFKV